MNSGRITRDVKIEQVRNGWKGFILHHGFFFIFPHTLIVNDGTGWMHNTNSINNLILVHSR